MDVAKVFEELLKISPLFAVAAVAIYFLWKSLQQKDLQVVETLKAHATDRKESQAQIIEIVNQNSLSNVRLAGSVDNLAKSVTDSKLELASRFTSLEGQVKRDRRTPGATSKQVTA